MNTRAMRISDAILQRRIIVLANSSKIRISTEKVLKSLTQSLSQKLQLSRSDFIVSGIPCMK